MSCNWAWFTPIWPSRDYIPRWFICAKESNCGKSLFRLPNSFWIITLTKKLKLLESSHRELLKPVLNAHHMDVDNYDFYIQNEKSHETTSLLFAASSSSSSPNSNENSKENTSLVDLNCNCEQLAGLELYIKRTSHAVFSLSQIFSFTFHYLIKFRFKIEKLSDSVAQNSSNAQMPSFSLKSRKTSLQTQNSNQESSSTSNWPYIFSSKSNGKDKLTVSLLTFHAFCSNLKI